MHMHPTITWVNTAVSKEEGINNTSGRVHTKRRSRDTVVLSWGRNGGCVQCKARAVADSAVDVEKPEGPDGRT